MAKDSVKVDTSDMDVETVMATIKEIVGKKIPV